MGYYSSNIATSNQFKCKSNSVFSTLDDLYEKLNTVGWCEMSAFAKKQWDPTNRCCGQCNATVLLVQEFFGGEIIEYDNPTSEKPKHFFNRIQGIDIDLTSEQFNPPLAEYSQKKKRYKTNSKLAYQYEKSAYILKLRLGLLE